MRSNRVKERLDFARPICRKETESILRSQYRSGHDHGVMNIRAPIVDSQDGWNQPSDYEALVRVPEDSNTRAGVGNSESFLGEQRRRR